MKKALLTTTLLFFSAFVFSQNDDTDDQTRFERIIDNLAESRAIADNASIGDYERMERERFNTDATLYGETLNTGNEKLFSCMMLFAEYSYCQCLADKLPMLVSFIDFAGLITNTGRELDLLNQPAEFRQLFNIVREVREECITAKAGSADN